MRYVYGKGRGGFTLVEIVAVVAILAVIAGIALSRIGTFASRARVTAAEADLAVIRDAILNEETGYLRDMRGIGGFSPSELRIANLLIATNLFGLAAPVGGIYPRGVRVDDPHVPKRTGVAPAEAFTRWSVQRERGWRGPYVRMTTGVFPRREDAAARGFYPPLSGLYLPEKFTSDHNISIYGFPGECALLDPWGNPYVLQIPPPQAFTNENAATVTPQTRFEYARLVSAGPDGKLDTPCFAVNDTNDLTVSVWTPRTRRLARQAGLTDGDNYYLRGDDIVLFLLRNDIDEGETP